MNATQYKSFILIAPVRTFLDNKNNWLENKKQEKKKYLRCISPRCDIMVSRKTTN